MIREQTKENADLKTSMAPTLQTNERFVINTRTKSFIQGDIVVFWRTGGGEQQFVKRIIGVGGDTIELKDDKVTKSSAWL